MGKGEGGRKGLVMVIVVVVVLSSFFGGRCKKDEGGTGLVKNAGLCSGASRISCHGKRRDG